MKKLLFLSLFFSPVLLAAPADFCTSLQQVKQKVLYCEDNGEFVKAAQACLEKLDLEVASVQARLASGFVNNGQASGQEQSAKYANLGENLTDTSDSLSGLDKTALQARSELLAYYGALMLSGNPTLELLRRYNLAGFLSSFPCYRSNREELISKIKKLDLKLAELRHTRAAVLAQFARSNRALNGLAEQNRSPASARPLAHAVAIGSAAFHGVNRAASSSTITGEIKAELK